MMFTAFTFPLHTSASVDLSGTTLSSPQKYFLRVIGSLSRADYYEENILASVTLGQAVYESGWGMFSISVGACNLFGIKAFETWDGTVYDYTSSLLYSSYDDYLLSAGISHVNTYSAWRAHDNWAESVKTHSQLLVESSRYAAAVGEKNYKTAIQAIVDAGYCTDKNYVQNVCKIIEQYGLTEYDNLTPDKDGIIAVITKQERKWLNVGDTYTVPLTYYPSNKTPSALTWKSDNPSVATVDQNGKVTAVSHGMTLITATLANGREAACIVYVDCNATAIENSPRVYTSPSTSASTNGLIFQGTGIKVTDTNVYTDANGTPFYKVTGYNSNGKLVSGYVLAKYVFLNKRNVSSIKIVKDDITLKKGDTYAVRHAVAPADAVDTTLTWTSSNNTVATVNQNGVITAKSYGDAVITAKAVGGAERKINVTVATDYCEYDAVASAYSALTVRSGPSTSTSSLGKIPFLSKVKVIGEPDGIWCKIRGTTSSGVEITGYTSSLYLFFLKSGYEIKYGTAPANTTVYSENSTSSTSYGKLSSGSKYAVVSSDGSEWSYVIGVSTSGNSVRGYAMLSGNSEPNMPDIGLNVPGGYYGRTLSNLNVRSGAGTSYSIVGQLPLGGQIAISGEAENGWYKVTGKSQNGDLISGYASSEHVVVLYLGTVTATTLNVRSEPTTSSGIVKQLSEGTKVVLVGEASNNWYAIESLDGTVKGYCSATYITFDGKISTNGTAEEKFGITDSKITITSGLLNGVSAKTKVSDLLKCFTGKVSVVDAKGNALANDKLAGTGCKIRVTENGNTSDVATIVVKGDIDGNGEISSTDYVYIKRYFLGTYDLSGAYYQAALLSGSAEINVVDYVFVKRICLGTYTIK